jgi:energy-coupling factor transporter ATP-binding protein EcfA2
MPSPFVKIQDVWTRYRLGKVTVDALRGVSLAVERGEFLAIAGPSESGKTTVLNLIGSLDTPTSGTIVLESAEVNGLRPGQLAELRSQKIGSDSSGLSASAPLLPQPLDVSTHCAHHVSSIPTATRREMRHGPHRQTDPREPHHYRRFPR